MEKVYEYSHLGGTEILQMHYPMMLEEIDWVIANVKASKKKISKEKNKKGRLLYDPKDMNLQFKNLFNEKGYKELRDTYTIKIPNYAVEIKHAYKQIDFCKDKVLIEVQLGKYAFMFYDLAKFQYFFNENKASVGIEIVPSHSLHKEMSSGVSYGEQLVYDVERLKRHFPAVPIEVIFIDIDKN